MVSFQTDKCFYQLKLSDVDIIENTDSKLKFMITNNNKYFPRLEKITDIRLSNFGSCYTDPLDYVYNQTARGFIITPGTGGYGDYISFNPLDSDGYIITNGVTYSNGCYWNDSVDLDYLEIEKELPRFCN